MCDFKPGDEVVCVAGGSKTFPGCGHVDLIEGKIYTIDAIWYPGEIGETGYPIGDEPSVQLVELGRLVSGRHAGFRASRFRKVQRRDLSAWLKTSVGNTDKLDKRAPAKEGAA